MAWLELGEHPELELADVLPAELLEQVHAWTLTPLPEMPATQWERDVIRTILRLRERQIHTLSKQTQSLVAEAQVQGDIKAAHYLAALQDLSDALRRVQQALSR